ncbi:hypothetical protein P5C85_21135 [Pseudomonas aeruginosa]|nr:hypothetical protein [Pseudomonas aeruginosa]
MATHALLLESGTVLFFDVVTDYSVQQQTQTTEHTLETGAVTSDHIIQQARQIQLNAILSDADFNYDRPTDTAIRQASAETGQDLSRTQVQDPLNRINAKETQPLVTVSDSGLSIVSGLLGDAGVPSVTVPDQGKTTPAREVAERLSEIERAGQTVTLLTFRLDESGAALPDKTYTDMLITNLTFNEDQDSGDGVFFSMSLQQLRYFSLEKSPSARTRVVNLPRGRNAHLSRTMLLMALKSKLTPQLRTFSSPRSLIRTPMNIG